MADTPVTTVDRRADADVVGRQSADSPPPSSPPAYLYVYALYQAAPGVDSPHGGCLSDLDVTGLLRHVLHSHPQPPPALPGVFIFVGVRGVSVSTFLCGDGMDGSTAAYVQAALYS